MRQRWLKPVKDFFFVICPSYLIGYNNRTCFIVCSISVNKKLFLISTWPDLRQEDIWRSIYPSSVFYHRYNKTRGKIYVLVSIKNPPIQSFFIYFLLELLIDTTFPLTFFEDSQPSFGLEIGLSEVWPIFT